MLKVKKLDPRATVPTVAHPGEDLAYDIYSLEDVILEPGKVTKVRTGIAVAAAREKRAKVYTGTSLMRCPDAKPRAEYVIEREPMGLLIRDRSSMASAGIIVTGGVIDAGYRGEILVALTYLDPNVSFGTLRAYYIKAGEKIAQMIPVPVLTGPVDEVDELPSGARGEKGFGSSGR